MFFESLESRQMFGVHPFASATAIAGLVKLTSVSSKVVKLNQAIKDVVGPRPIEVAPEDNTPFNNTNVTQTYNDWLVVNGTSGNDYLEVRPGARGKIDVTRNGVLAGSFDVGRIKRISMKGFGGNNTLLVSPQIYLPAYIGGGAGIDKIQGGSGHDTLWAGAGKDHITAGYGNDDIRTEGGDDFVLCGEGNDTVTGNSGHEWIAGEGGNDILKAEGGDDSVFGGRGDDKMYGGPGDDVLVSVFGGKRDSVSGDAG
jgi:Ca2+-binding RTX toxin-like protein